MAYSNNPYLSNVRRQAVNLVLRSGWNQTKVARHIGVHRTTIWRWLKLPGAKDQRFKLNNRSCRPHHHPKQLKPWLVDRITSLRHELKRCAYIIWRVLVNEGVLVSLASVGRVLARAGPVAGMVNKERLDGKEYLDRTSSNRAI